MRIDFVTLFPEMVLGALEHSMMKRAQDKGIARFSAVNPRDFTTDNHRTVDDVPYGGGPGMLLKIEPIHKALLSMEIAPGTPVVLTDPTGPLFSQEMAESWAQEERVVFLCGHYEGFDHRIRTQLATHAVSIGDYVLTGGELPALVMADALVRLQEGLLGNAGSLGIDSHQGEGLLSAPQYTRPEVYQGEAVPAVLRSGHHKEIAQWKRLMALKLTREIRPDLFSKLTLAKKELDMLSSDAWETKPNE